MFARIWYLFCAIAPRLGQRSRYDTRASFPDRHRGVPSGLKRDPIPEKSCRMHGSPSRYCRTALWLLLLSSSHSAYCVYSTTTCGTMDGEGGCTAVRPSVKRAPLDAYSQVGSAAVYPRLRLAHSDSFSFPINGSSFYSALQHMVIANRQERSSFRQDDAACRCPRLKVYLWGFERNSDFLVVRQMTLRQWDTQQKRADASGLLPAWIKSTIFGHKDLIAAEPHLATGPGSSPILALKRIDRRREVFDMVLALIGPQPRRWVNAKGHVDVVEALRSGQSAVCAAY
nr:hypothetical protein CFP56_72729 [Quercus suber]